jgi:hypothetical protein
MKLIDLLERAGHEVRPTGKPEEYTLTCPTCGKRKLYVNAEKWAWICYVCNEGGGAIKLFEKFGVDPKDAKGSDYEVLRRRAEEALAARTAPEESEPTPALPAEFQPLLVPGQKPQYIASRIIDYLHARGVTDEQVALWRLGYCPTGRYSGCLVIPVLDQDGQVASFQARTIIGGGPKSINPPGGGGFLFNVELARGHLGLVVVEGPFDAIAVHSVFAGRMPVSSVALLGHHCSEEQAAYIARGLRPEIAWVALDPDIEPEEMHRVGAQLRRNGCKDVRVALLPADPDELGFEALAAHLDAAEAAVGR